MVLKIIEILSVKRQLQKLSPEETALSIVLFQNVSEQFDVMDDIEVVVFIFFFLVFDGCQAELDCLSVVAAFLLKGLFEIVKWAFLGRSFGLGLCLGLERRSCDLSDCLFELFEIVECLLVGGCLFNQGASAEGINNIFCFEGFGHGCLFDCRNNLFGWFFDLKVRDGSLADELRNNLFHIFALSLFGQIV